MVAAEDAKVPAGVRELAFLDVFHPGTKDTHRNLVLLLARYGAGVATDAAVLIDDKPVTHKEWEESYARRLVVACQREEPRRPYPSLATRGLLGTSLISDEKSRLYTSVASMRTCRGDPGARSSRQSTRPPQVIARAFGT